MILEEYCLPDREGWPVNEDEYEMAGEIAELRNKLQEVQTRLSWTESPEQMGR